MADEETARMYTLKARPSQPVPAMLTFCRTTDSFPEIVMPEDKAFEMYLVLKEYFEGEAA